MRRARGVFEIALVALFPFSAVTMYGQTTAESLQSLLAPPVEPLPLIST